MFATMVWILVWAASGCNCRSLSSCYHEAFDDQTEEVRGVASRQGVRAPVVSGRFYEDDPAALRAQIRECYEHPLGVGERSMPRQGKLIGLIAPHAGYMFSGPVASWSFARLRDEEPRPGRVLLLGPKHTMYGSELAAARAVGWRTPLGTVSVAAELRDAVVAAGAAEADDDAHAAEHSLEVMLPFLQDVFAGAPMSILPLAIGYLSATKCREVGEALGRVLAEPEFADVVTVVSSDFSHETPRDEAWRLDAQALATIEKRDADGFYRQVVGEHRSICGVMPITVFLHATAALPLTVTRLTYATSMDVMPHPRGVGYAAVAFERTD